MDIIPEGLHMMKVVDAGIKEGKFRNYLFAILELDTERRMTVSIATESIAKIFLTQLGVDENKLPEGSFDDSFWRELVLNKSGEFFVHHQQYMRTWHSTIDWKRTAWLSGEANCGVS